MDRRTALQCCAAIALLPFPATARARLQPSLLSLGRRRWLVVSGARVDFGRADVHLKLTADPKARCISRRHLRIERADDGWRLVDLGSANGTTVGGRRLPKNGRVTLRNGQRIVAANLAHFTARVGRDWIALDPGRGASTGFVIRTGRSALAPEQARVLAGAGRGAAPGLTPRLGVHGRLTQATDPAKTFCGTPEY